MEKELATTTKELEAEWYSSMNEDNRNFDEFTLEALEIN